MFSKMKYETTSVAIKEFVWLKLKICSFFLDDSREHKNAKGVNKTVAATINHNEILRCFVE